MRKLKSGLRPSGGPAAVICCGIGHTGNAVSSDFSSALLRSGSSASIHSALSACARRQPATQPEASCPGPQPHGHIWHVSPRTLPPTLKSHVCHEALQACSHAARLGVSLAAAQPIAHDGTWLELWHWSGPADASHWQHCIVWPSAAVGPSAGTVWFPHHCSQVSLAGGVGSGGGTVPGDSHRCDSTERIPPAPEPWRHRMMTSLAPVFRNGAGQYRAC